MSENIAGFNFENQLIASRLLAATFRALFSDGKLYGCALTYSGQDVSIGTGMMVIGGHVFQILSAQTVRAPSGYTGTANVVATIDLTATSSTTEFEQVSFSCRAESATIRKDDLDAGGSVYEVVIGTVSVSNGTITAVASDIPSARRTIYEMSTAPDSSLGKDGDICILVGN